MGQIHITSAFDFQIIAQLIEVSVSLIAIQLLIKLKGLALMIVITLIKVL
jgi:hypothetical protein